MKDPKAYWDKLNANKCHNKKQSSQPTSQEFLTMFKSMGDGNARELPTHSHISEGEATTEDGSQSAYLSHTNFENVLLNDSITEKEVENAISSLKNNKAYGSDLIINEFLVHSSCKMLHNFVKLFNPLGTETFLVMY